MLGHYGAAPAIATPELCEEVVRNHLYSNSILCILSLQDWLSMDGKWRNPNVQEERINIPANPRHYWRYRMHLTLEQLMKAESLNEKIRELVKADRQKSGKVTSACHFKKKKNKERRVKPSVFHSSLFVFSNIQYLCQTNYTNIRNGR